VVRSNPPPSVPNGALPHVLRWDQNDGPRIFAYE
jgi:hypothetical protein